MCRYIKQLGNRNLSNHFESSFSPFLGLALTRPSESSAILQEGIKRLFAFLGIGRSIMLGVCNQNRVCSRDSCIFQLSILASFG